MKYIERNFVFPYKVTAYTGNICVRVGIEQKWSDALKTITRWCEQDKESSYNKYSYKVEIMDEPLTTTTRELKEEDEGDD